MLNKEISQTLEFYLFNWGEQSQPENHAIRRRECKMFEAGTLSVEFPTEFLIPKAMSRTQQAVRKYVLNE